MPVVVWPGPFDRERVTRSLGKSNTKPWTWTEDGKLRMIATRITSAVARARARAMTMDMKLVFGKIEVSMDQARS
jgi:hypothetical protein